MLEVGKQRREGLATARVFFALWPNEAVREQFMQWAKLLHEICGGSITKPGNLHITLAFLGNVAVSRLDELKALASKLGGSAFSLDFTAPGYWRHNRIAWAAPDETPQVLSDLVKKLECSLQIAGFSFDERPYAPHLTLLRKARWDPPPYSFKNIKWEISEFVLVRSNRTENGSEYEVIGRWPLFFALASTQESELR
jgi:RNA 2',3'-cyclic 3'-phosphodiesterase